MVINIYLKDFKFNIVHVKKTPMQQNLLHIIKNCKYMCIGGTVLAMHGQDKQDPDQKSIAIIIQTRTCIINDPKSDTFS